MNIKKIKLVIGIFVFLVVALPFSVVNSQEYYKVDSSSRHGGVNTEKIEVYGDCQRVSTIDSPSIHVPVRTSAEWYEFKANHPSHVNVCGCRDHKSCNPDGYEGEVWWADSCGDAYIYIETCTYCCSGGSCSGNCKPGTTKSCSDSCSYNVCSGDSCVSKSNSDGGSQTCSSNCTWGSCDASASCPSDECSDDGDCGDDDDDDEEEGCYCDCICEESGCPDNSNCYDCCKAGGGSDEECVGRCN